MKVREKLIGILTRRGLPCYYAAIAVDTLNKSLLEAPEETLTMAEYYTYSFNLNPVVLAIIDKEVPDAEYRCNFARFSNAREESTFQPSECPDVIWDPVKGLSKAVTN